VEYDERLTVPPVLLKGIDRKRLMEKQWFPVILDGDTVIVAAVDPRDPDVATDAGSRYLGYRLEIRVSIIEDIIAFHRDFLNSEPEHLSWCERTGLAFWRNNMARWRTRLACYRTDFAIARTRLSLLRGGLGLIMIGRTFLHIRKTDTFVPYLWAMIAAGLAVVLYGLVGYFRLKISLLSPPGQQTLVEVSSSTLYFFENYQFVEEKEQRVSSKKTMLARLADTVVNYRISMDGSFDNKARSALAHERNIMAAQRTVMSCYRTIYARARVGLSFIRTGVSFSSIALGLMKYFGFNVLTVFDVILLMAGIAMIVDGVIWYWPVHKEQQEFQNVAMLN
jgi:uncharacterized membrane protein YidH (DUF202 family)